MNDVALSPQTRRRPARGFPVPVRGALTRVNPTTPWPAQLALNPWLVYTDCFSNARALVRDLASQFIGDFDKILQIESFKAPKTPVGGVEARSCV